MGNEELEGKAKERSIGWRITLGTRTNYKEVVKEACTGVCLRTEQEKDSRN
jgi:hypothetical protein